MSIGDDFLANEKTAKQKIDSNNEASLNSTLFLEQCYFEVMAELHSQGEDNAILSSDKTTPQIPPDAAEIARKYEQTAQLALAEVHRGLKITTDGSNSRSFAFQRDFTVKSDTTVEGLAKHLLGPKASQEQVNFYVKQLLSVNDIAGDGKAMLLKDQIITLLGHSADGGIIIEEHGLKTILWYDKSSRKEFPDGNKIYTFVNKQGEIVTISSHHSDLSENFELKTKDGKSVRVNADGITTEFRVNGKTTNGDEISVVTKAIFSDGRVFELFYKKDEMLPQRVLLKQKGKINREFFWTAHGDLATKSGEQGISLALLDGNLNIDLYKRRVRLLNKDVEQIYENGEVKRIDKEGKLLYHKWTDGKGSTVEEKYKTGEAKPYEIVFTPKTQGSKPLVFRRTPAGRYESPIIQDGKKIGFAEFIEDPRGAIDFHDRAAGITRSELAMGAIIITHDLPHSRAKETITTPAGETIVIVRDRQGIVREQDYRDGKGLVVYSEINRDGKRNAVTIQERDGSRTALKFDRDLGMLSGKRIAQDGTVESVILNGDVLIYVNDKTKAIRTEIFLYEDPDDVPTFILGQYDANRGIVSYKMPGKATSTIAYLAPGRQDTVYEDGTIEGSTVNGERSYIKRNGETVIEHADGRKVRLNPDNTIDRWGPTDKDVGTREKLLPIEEQYLRSHNDIDRRDFAEIYRCFAQEPAKRESFYRALTRIDHAQNLSPEEKSALRKNLMSHVAKLAEVYQGSSFCCNVSSIQRSLASKMPDKYVNLMIDALSKGGIALSDGKEFKVDVTNLKMIDTTGRDLVSRAFQTIAVGLAFRGGIFRNTVDGVGDLRDADGNKVAFDGISMAQIANIYKQLTGEEKAVIHLERQQDLLELFKANGGGPMIIHVDGNRPPFGAGGPIGELGNHVVTLSHIDEGPPLMFYVQNQWGLEGDHSTPQTAIQGYALWEAMTSGSASAQVIASCTGEAIDHRKVYKFIDGKLEIDENLTRKQQQREERWRR